ncbi:MAG: retrotransposon gag domain-containing protein, partial [Proteobacteria bacterium]|nr:retrotransposon gag domain-containing protein [Pseudomonadota bacterium]
DNTRLTDSLLDPDISTASKNIQVTDSDDTYLTVDSTELLEKLTLQVPVYRALSCPQLNNTCVYTPQVPPIPTKHSLLDKSVHSCTDEPKLGHKPLSSSTPVETSKGGDSVLTSLRKKLQEIIYHKPAFKVPPVDAIVAPGIVAPNNLQIAQNRLNNMAAQGQGRARVGRGLQGADPALVQILQRLEDRDNNRDHARKKFLMFPTGRFNGTTKGAAKSHWLEFEKYVDYQQQELALLPPNQFDSTKQMFRLTLTDNALGWYDAEQGNWTNIDQMKQAFLKRFNIWGDTRRQQQDSWNKLKFNMAKDDVDAFVTDMKTLASILGHDEHILIEKFKDVFPDKNIEAALIAMDDLDQMQAKAKQLVQIYKPSYETDTSSAGLCLVHTHTPTPDTEKKPKKKEKVSNQHELAPRQTDSRNYSPNDRSTNNPRNTGNSPRTNNYQQGQSNNQNNRGYYRENNFNRG